MKRSPGHEGIEGNKEADRLAKEGSKMAAGDAAATYAAARRKIRTIKDQQFKDWWEKALSKHKRYGDLGLKATTLKCPKELNMPRTTLHHLLA